MTETFASYGIKGVNTYGARQQKVLCPRCSRDRRKTSDRCLSVNVAEGIWNCHHCGWSGTIKKSTKPDIPAVPDADSLSTPEDSIISYFNGRGITAEVVQKMQIAQRLTMFGKKTAKAIAFPYYYDGKVVNIKYRTSDKQFKQVYQGAKVLYNHDVLSKCDEYVIITEGEIDALSYMQAGLECVVSVPDGAPNADAKNVDGKLSFIDEFYDDFSHIKRIYLAVDNDPNGRRLREELARRLGKSRCSVITFPEGVKDANEYLVKCGASALKATIDTATPYPIEGIHTILEYGENLDEIFASGYPVFSNTGYERFDRLIKFPEGQLTIITGIPGHGKSVFLENVANRLALKHGWRFAWYTPEHSAASHAHRLIENHVGKPMLPGYNGRMSKEEYDKAKVFLADHHYYIVPDNETYSVEDVLGRAEYLVGRYGVKSIVIDAYNQLEHTLSKGETETVYVSRFLNSLKFWAREHGVHFFLVAHPTKMQKSAGEQRGGTNANRYDVPTLYSIAGSAHFYNIPDNGFTVYRDIDVNGQTKGTRVYVQKVKFDWQGGIGYANFEYDVACKRFVEV